MYLRNLMCNNIIYSVLLLTIVSCVHDPIIEVVETPILISEHPCDENTVYFEEQILPILQGCATTECHDAVTAEEDVILDSYDNLIESGIINLTTPENSKIYKRVTDDDLDDRMPPDPANPLSMEQTDLILQWIQQGAEENSCPELICDTLEVTFALDIEPMVQTFCAACHTGIMPVGSIQIGNYDEIVDVASESVFIDIIDGEFDFTMPQNTDGLTDCQVRMFEIWIEDGMPNN